MIYILFEKMKNAEANMAAKFISKKHFSKAFKKKAFGRVKLQSFKKVLKGGGYYISKKFSRGI
jgi:hypothetical protein